MTNTTTITTTITAEIVKSMIASTVRNMVRDTTTGMYSLSMEGHEGVDRVAIWCLRHLGVRTYSYTGEFEDDNDRDFLFESDKDGTFRTWAGIVLTREVHQWDFSGSPKNDHDLVEYGDPHYGYQCRILAQTLPIEIIIEVHKLVYQVIPGLIKVCLEDLAAERRQFGVRKNAELKEAGCDNIAVKAWWGMHWKHEHTPERWIGIYLSLSDEMVESAMLASSHKQLAKAGVSLGLSYPRTMDIIESIAKARGLRAIKASEPIGKSEGGIEPTSVDGDGSRRWSF